MVPEVGVLYGLVLAYSGRTAEAIAQGERALEAVDASVHPEYELLQLIRIYLVAGRTNQALERLEELLQSSYHVTPAWLRIDPTFDQLRGNPRFEKMVNGKW